MSTPSWQRELVAVLDFGSQYAQLIARRVRELGVYCELFSPDVPVEELRKTLRLRPTAFDMALRSLVLKGLVQLEPLEARTYIRPLTTLGHHPAPLPIDEDDPAFM